MRPICTLLFVFLCASAFAQPSKLTLLDRKGGLEACIAGVKPTAADEKFLQTPWRTEIFAARREADAAGKPLFMWAMNGDPLGCT